MGLLADTSTVKVYFDAHGDITEQQTEDWVEVLNELSAAQKEKFQPISKRYTFDQNTGKVEIELKDAVDVPYEFLASVIKAWSLDMPVTVQTLKRVKYKILRNLTQYLAQKYGLISTVEEDVEKI